MMAQQECEESGPPPQPSSFADLDNPDARLDLLRGVGRVRAPAQAERAGEEERRDLLERDVQFCCARCGLSEMCQYHGRKPQFVRNGLEFSEDCYVMLDPFTPYRSKAPNNFLVLGSDCAGCGETVCVECSLYFTKRICMQCAQFNINEFPSEVQKRVVRLTESAAKQNKAS